MSGAYEAAVRHTREGWAVVPVPQGSKAPALEGWQRLRLAEADLPRYFASPAQNLGALLGIPSDDLVESDLDCREALVLAHWLPDTDRVSGRPGNPGSHRWYIAGGLDTRRFKDTDGATLVELRSTGTQTLLPPSLHPSGERYAWERDGPPARVADGALAAAVARVAAGALLARHWPAKGGRHDCALALAGVLARAGWPENEAADFIRDVARAAGDEEWRDRGAGAATSTRRIVNDGPATGLPTLARLLTDGEAVVARLREWLNLPAPHTAPSSKRVGAAAPAAAPGWPAPLDAAALHGLAGDVVRTLEPHTEADPAALLVNTLVMLGSAIGPAPHTLVGDTRHGVNLFAALVGETAKGRKGTSESGPRRLAGEADPAWLARVVAGLSSGEGLIHSVRDPVRKDDPIRDPKTREITGYEAVIVDGGVADKRLLVTEQEFAATLRIMARDGNTLSPVLRQAWDGEHLRTLIKNSPETATTPHISILGHITRDELLRYLDATESANGFANRFLWCCVRRSKVLPEGGRADHAALAALARRIADALACARSRDLVRRDEEARALWADVYPDLSEGRPGLFGAVTARAEAQVLRLSLLYALLDHAPAIRAAHLHAALAVWDYSEASARYIFGDATGDPIADRILRELRTTGPLTQSEIVDLFKRHVRQGLIDRALETLDGARLAGSEREETGGRPRTVWRAL